GRRLHLDLGEHLEPADLRELEIEQHDRGVAAGAQAKVAAPVEVVERLLAVADDDHLVREVILVQGGERQIDVLLIVLDQEDPLDVLRHGLGSFARGNETWKVAPRSTSPSARTCPPCRSMIRLTLARPMPTPSNSSPWRRWKTSNSLSTYLMSNPTPLSRTEISTSSPAARASTSITALVRRAVYFTAFESRLPMTTSSIAGSALTVGNAATCSSMSRPARSGASLSQ